MELFSEKHKKVTSWWHSESLGRSLDPGSFLPFQGETHQQRAGGPAREDSHWGERGRNHKLVNFSPSFLCELEIVSTAARSST
ncbi:hypothetical protein EYF80_052146 [Liparis tanakae]|uniref:Uncharacterized protein n=1 Tax=Liparis tanakae TaxID=230148 RepID=A0A4Z2F8Y0_9TELE|nr:hypothetical protein EYF80_052146 [Liparis tanakae]